MKGQTLETALPGNRMERRLRAFLDKKDKMKLHLYGFSCFSCLFFDLFSLSMILPVLRAAAEGKTSDSFIWKLVTLGAALLGKSGCELIRIWLSNSFTEDVAQIWAVKLYRLFCKESLQEHNQATIMQKVTAVRTDTETCADILVSFIECRINGMMLVCYFLSAAFAGYAKGCLWVSLFVTAGMKLYWNSRSRILKYGEQKRQSEIQESALIALAHNSYKEIKIDSRIENLIKKYDQISKEYTAFHKEYVLLKAAARITISNAVEIITLLSSAVLLAAGISQRTLAVNLISILTFMVYIIPRANLFLVEFTSIQYGKKSYDAFCKNMLKYESLQSQGKKEEQMRKKEISFIKGLRIENLTFHYPDGADLLKDVSLDVPAGTSVAIIGKSGIGKTTFLDLVLGLLPPQSGRIWYDNYELTEGKDEQGPCIGDIGRIISYIPQSVYLSDDTIYNNVVFMEEPDREKAVACLKQARIWEDIKNLPMGIDTVLGENGFAISMGQRQRIAIARALYKESRFLVMDEMTAALDRETEREVIRSLKDMKVKRTLLLATHHEALAEECDFIYRLENQKLIRIR